MDRHIQWEMEDHMGAITPHTMAGIPASQTWPTVTIRPTITVPLACFSMKADRPRTELAVPTVAAALAARTPDPTAAVVQDLRTNDLWEQREVDQVETVTASKTLVVMDSMRTGRQQALITILLACRHMDPDTILHNSAPSEEATGVLVSLNELSGTIVTVTMVPGAQAAAVASATVDTVRIHLEALSEPAA
jgi:hypothetical protein